MCPEQPPRRSQGSSVELVLSFLLHMGSRGGTQSETLYRKRKVRVWIIAQSVKHAVPYKDLSSIPRLHNKKEKSQVW